MVFIEGGIRIPIAEFEFSYARSSGPGGQNVNKVNSKAILHWNLTSSPSLTPDMRSRLLAKLSHKLNSLGEIVISSDRFRDQTRNRDDCFEKFKTLIASAASTPKLRKKTKASRSSILKNKRIKEQHSLKKKLRRTASHLE